MNERIRELADEAAKFSAVMALPTGDSGDNLFVEKFAALVAAHEREACAKVCDDKATHLKMKAQEAIEAGEHDEVSAIRSTAWQLSVCADAIRARGEE